MTGHTTHNEHYRWQPLQFSFTYTINPNFAEEEPEPYYPACESGDVYPVRRRAQRLSVAIWPSISRDDRELQMALEATSPRPSEIGRLWNRGSSTCATSPMD